MSVQVDAVFDNIAALTDFANSTTPNTIWQSFKSGSSQYLYGVQLYGKTPDTIISGQPVSAIGVNITIYNGTGTGGSVFATLTSATVDATGPTWVPFVFPSPFSTLVNGNTYTIAISGPGAEFFLWGYSYNSPTSSYPDGEASFQPPSDLFFKVEVIPVPVDPNIPNTFTFVEVEDGSAAAPSYTFINELTTGLYRSGVGELAVSAAGTGVVTIDTGSLRPTVTDVYDLGQPGIGRWANFYLAGAGQNTFFQSVNTTDVPFIQATGVNPVFTYGIQSGNFIRIGTILLISGTITWTAVAGGAGDLYIESIFTETVINSPLVNILLDGITYPAGTSPIGLANTGFSAIRINLVCNTSGAAPTPITVAMLPAAGSIRYNGTIALQPSGGP